MTVHQRMPPLAWLKEMVHEWVVPSLDTLSPVIVDRDGKISLPKWDAKVKLNQIPRTFYIFFLAHPEGVRLKELSDHLRHLHSIAEIVCTKGDDAKTRASIEQLTLPGSDNFRSMLSKIAQEFRRAVPLITLSMSYAITGKAGGRYRVQIDPRLVNLPKWAAEPK